MPKIDLQKFKIKRTAQFAATICEGLYDFEKEKRKPYEKMMASLNRYSNALFDYNEKMKREIFKQDYPSPEDKNNQKAAEKAYKTTENIIALIKLYKNLKTNMQKREAIVDLTKLLDSLQEQQQILEDNYADFDPTSTYSEFDAEQFGSPEQLDRFAKNNLLQPGLDILTGPAFDEDNIAVVRDFDRVSELRPYDKDLTAQWEKSYLNNSARENEFYIQTNKLEENEIRYEEQEDFDPENAFVEDEPNADYVPDPVTIFQKQRVFKDKLVFTYFPIGNEPIDPNSSLGKLKSFSSELSDLHKQIKNGNFNNAKPEVKAAMEHLDQVLFGKIDENPKNGLLRRINSFLNKIQGADSMIEISDEERDELVAGPRGYISIIQQLKDIQNDPLITKTFKTMCLNMQKSMESTFENTLNAVEEPDPYIRYLIGHSGGFGIDHINNSPSELAKVNAAYEWKRNSLKIQDPKQRPHFDPAEIDKNAKELENHPIMRAAFIKKNELGGESWDGEKIQNTLLNHQEYKVNNRIEKPLSYDSMADKKREALKQLKELGTIIGSAEGASEGYQRFNRALKDLGNKDIDAIRPQDLGGMLDNIYKVTESYMKGRKSKRWTDSQQEHFDQTLDVLAIISKTGRNGEELANKLVNRVNYVRTHRWHNLYDQETVTLEGRNNAATKARLENANKNAAAESGKKPL